MDDDEMGRCSPRCATPRRSTASTSGLFSDFLTSMRMDLTITDYPDRASLNTYMHGSADVIGLELLPVLGTVGPRDEAAPYAAALGKAFQLTNFLRDVDEDLTRERVYLPADELAAFDVDRDLLTWCHVNRRTDPRVRRALAAQHHVTRGIYRVAGDGVQMLAPQSRPCVATAFTLYSEILDRIEAIDFAVFSQRAASVRAACKSRAVYGSGLAGPSRRWIRCGRVMDRWQYLIVLGACLLITAPLEIFGAGVYRQPGAPSAPSPRWRSCFCRLGRDRDCRPCVDVQPALYQRHRRRVLDSGGGAAVLHRDPGVRPADLFGGQHDPRDRARATMTGLGYTLPAVIAVVVVVAAELAVLRTGLFGKIEYWISMLIVVAFQVIRSTAGSPSVGSPIVIYNEKQTSGLRFPCDIPVEDFLFGFAMVTAVLLLWERQRERR